MSATCQSIGTKNTHISDTYGQATLVIVSKWVNRNRKCINFTLKSLEIIFEQLKIIMNCLTFLQVPCCLQTYNRRSLLYSTEWDTAGWEWLMSWQECDPSIYSLLTCIPWGIKEDKKISKVYSPKAGTTWMQMTTWCHNINLFGVYCALLVYILKLAKSLISLPWKFTFPSFVLYIIKLGELFTGLSAKLSWFC